MGTRSEKYMDEQDDTRKHRYIVDEACAFVRQTGFPGYPGLEGFEETDLQPESIRHKQHGEDHREGEQRERKATEACLQAFGGKSIRYFKEPVRDGQDDGDGGNGSVEGKKPFQAQSVDGDPGTGCEKKLAAEQGECIDAQHNRKGIGIGSPTRASYIQKHRNKRKQKITCQKQRFFHQSFSLEKRYGNYAHEATFSRSHGVSSVPFRAILRFL